MIHTPPSHSSTTMSATPPPPTPPHPTPNGIQSCVTLQHWPSCHCPAAKYTYTLPGRPDGSTTVCCLSEQLYGFLQPAGNYQAPQLQNKCILNGNMSSTIITVTITAIIIIDDRRNEPVMTTVTDAVNLPESQVRTPVHTQPCSPMPYQPTSTREGGGEGQ